MGVAVPEASEPFDNLTLQFVPPSGGRAGGEGLGGCDVRNVQLART